jgi:hypothetical protein
MFNERVLRFVTDFSANETIVSPQVMRYNKPFFGNLYRIETPEVINNPERLLKLLHGGKSWFHGHDLVARPIFNYIMLDLVRASIVPSVVLAFSTKNVIYLGTHIASLSTDYDWDTITSALGKALYEHAP